MVIIKERVSSGEKFSTLFEKNGIGYMADVCHPMDYPWRCEGLISPVDSEGYIDITKSVCVEVDSISKEILGKLVNDFMNDKMDSYTEC